MNCLESYDVNAEYADDKKLIRNCNLKKRSAAALFNEL